MARFFFQALFLFLIISPSHATFECSVFGEFGKNTLQYLANHQVLDVSVSRESGVKGAKLYLVKKRNPSLSWGSPYEHHTGAKQGDPRWISNVYGPDVAHLFGYKALGSSEYLIPNAEHVNAMIDKLQPQLSQMKFEPISVRYYSSEDRVRMEEYLSRFAKHAALPIAEGSYSMVHDTAYHVASIALPQKIVEKAQKNTKYLLDFLNSKKHLISTEDRKNMMMFQLQQILRAIQLSALGAI